jgi:hypothetical protein
MKTIIKTIWCILVLAVSAGATNYTVKAGGRGNFTTIQACANAAVASDTCTVYAGTYNEAPSLSVSGRGSAGVCTLCITFIVNTGDTVTTQPWNVAASYVIINGFTITDPTLSIGNAGVYIHAGTNGVQILNNIITQVGRVTSSGYDCISMQDGASHYTTIKGNTISWCSAVPGAANGNPSMQSGIQVLGDHILVQNNDISHVTNSIQVGGGSTQVALIGNTWHDSFVGPNPLAGTNPPASDAPNCLEGQNGCDSHLDAMEASGGGNNELLIENYTVKNIWGTGGAHMFFASASTTTDVNFITRFNKGYKVGSAHLANEADTSAPDGVTYWKDYNDTYIVSQQQSAGQNWAFCGSTSAHTNNGSFLNNLFYNDVKSANAAHAPYYSWSGTSCLTGFRSGYNLGFDTACSAGTLAGCTNGQMASDTGNIYADPKLVATDGTNFDLHSDSPALNAGTYLTTVASSDTGSGTSLIVSDAAYFQDGWGIPGVGADCISVTTVGNHVCITAVNYSTNTITLASSITRSSGGHIWLYSDSTGRTVLIGSAPDIGAGFDPASGPAAPTGLAALVK